MAKNDLKTWVGIFLIIVGVLPLIGISLGSFVGKIVNVLLIVAGILLIVK